MCRQMIRVNKGKVAIFFILIIGVFISSCATSNKSVQQEVIDGVTITYLTGKPTSTDAIQEVPAIVRQHAQCVENPGGHDQSRPAGAWHEPDRNEPATGREPIYGDCR